MLDIKASIEQAITVEGPIPVTEESHPFSSAAYAREPLNLSEYGYLEEEYFIEGKANVYQGDEKATIKHEGLAYKNRILVRKPEDPAKFSGRVYLDIYNASNGYDIEDVWRRSYQYYLENGHIYIGITSKPINVLSLKNFDYERYESLNWSGKETAPQPATISPSMSIPGTEEGLVWDMISQLGFQVKSNQLDFLADYPVDYLYLTGQSQSGMYLNSYVYYFHEAVQEIFDGYLTVVGTGVMRDLNQYDNPETMFSVRKQLLPENLSTPFISLSSQGDINLFGVMNSGRDAFLEKMEQSDEPTRHYELASSPHTDPASPLIPDNKEIVKTKNPAKLLDGEYSYTVNSIQLAYYVNSCLEFLHQWASEGVAPPESLHIEREKPGQVKTDDFGNGLKGVRSAYVDVPLARYDANAIEEGQDPNQVSASVNGSMTYLTKEEFYKLYDSREDYLKQFEASVQKQVDEKWLIPADAKRMLNWAQETVNDRF